MSGKGTFFVFPGGPGPAGRPPAGFRSGSGPPDFQELGALAVVSVLFSPASGNLVFAPAVGADSLDNVATSGTENKPIQISRLTGFDGTNWDRIRALSDGADAQAPTTVGAMLALARMQAFDGTNFARLRTASAANLSAAQAPFPLLSANPGQWAIQQTPGSATQATITRAAGGAGVRHVCNSISISLLAVAAQGQIIFNLRDGASGAGTILWSISVIALAGDSKQITISGLQIFGTANTAMTLESAAAPAATNFATVALTGYDAI